MNNEEIKKIWENCDFLKGLREPLNDDLAKFFESQPIQIINEKDNNKED